MADPVVNHVLIPFEWKINTGYPQGIKLYIQAKKQIDKEAYKLDISVSNSKDIIYHFLSLSKNISDNALHSWQILVQVARTSFIIQSRFILHICTINLFEVPNNLITSTNLYTLKRFSFVLTSVYLQIMIHLFSIIDITFSSFPNYNSFSLLFRILFVSFISLLVMHFSGVLFWNTSQLQVLPMMAIP